MEDADTAPISGRKDQFKMKTTEKIALITGMNGFIGRHLADFLFSKNIKVAGLPRELLFDPTALKGYIEELKPNYIYHLAAAGNIQGRHTDDEIFISNIFGTYNLLTATKDIRYDAFINFSSLSVKLPVKTQYSATKLSAEYLCQVFAKNNNQPVVSVRPSTIYGEGEQSEHLIPTIIRNIRVDNSQPMKFVRSPLHDFLYVGDLVEAVYELATKADKFAGQVVEIGSGVEYSNGEVLTILEGFLGKLANIEEVESLRAYDTKLGWKVDKKGMKKLNWKYKTSLPEGLQKTVNWFLTNENTK